MTKPRSNARARCSNARPTVYDFDAGPVRRPRRRERRPPSRDDPPAAGRRRTVAATRVDGPRRHAELPRPARVAAGAPRRCRTCRRRRHRPIDRGMLAERGMIVPGAPVGALAEEFRLVKRQLLLTARGGSRVATRRQGAQRSSSARPSPDEGKTFCAVNLALSMAAERDTEVLLVDADFAKPDVHAPARARRRAGPARCARRSAIDLETLRDPHRHSASFGAAGRQQDRRTTPNCSPATAPRAVIARLLAANPRRIADLRFAARARRVARRRCWRCMSAR